MATAWLGCGHPVTARKVIDFGHLPAFAQVFFFLQACFKQGLGSLESSVGLHKNFPCLFGLGFCRMLLHQRFLDSLAPKGEPATKVVHSGPARVYGGALGHNAGTLGLCMVNSGLFVRQRRGHGAAGLFHFCFTEADQCLQGTCSGVAHAGAEVESAVRRASKLLARVAFSSRD